MEKVAGVQYYSAINSGPTGHIAANNTIEKSTMIRGHHSSISKAVEAHREMVEQRQNRHGRRDLSMLSNGPNVDVLTSQQVAIDGGSMGNDSDYAYENTLIESPSTQAKMAAIQSFQSTEPERPALGEPVPKGSYLDIEA